MNRFPLLPLAWAATFAAAPAAAQNLADPAAIDRAVEQFTGAAIGMDGGAAAPVDRRLRLQACPAALALRLYGTRQNTVEVACPAPGGWRIYVPLIGAGTAVAAPVIQRGDAVTIRLGGDGFTLSQPGEALEAGAAGSWIRVRPLGPGAQPLRARVERPGLVGIVLP